MKTINKEAINILCSMLVIIPKNPYKTGNYIMKNSELKGNVNIDFINYIFNTYYIISDAHEKYLTQENKEKLAKLKE